MSITLGSNISGVYVGGSKIGSAYLGSSLIFEDTPSQETVTIGGRAYPVVTIGTQKWLAENLDFKASGITIRPSGTPTTPAAWYYDNNEATYGVNGNKYGLLYNWYAVNYLNRNRASLFPGWHVPKRDEWTALANAIGGTGIAGSKLKSSTGWSSGNGTDDFGFAVFPAGCRWQGRFNSLGTYADFWTTSTYGSAYAYYIYFATNSSLSSTYQSTEYAFSVRLVADA